MRQVFVDMDGVLADFDRHYRETFGGAIPKRTEFDKDGHDVDWTAIEKHKDFYLNIPPMSDAQELWSYVVRLRPAPIILTGIPSTVLEAADNKRAWVHKHLGKNIEVCCCRSTEKCLYARPGDILIDDWIKYRDLWLAKGGVWITHTSAKSSIDQLLKLNRGAM